MVRRTSEYKTLEKITAKMIQLPMMNQSTIKDAPMRKLSSNTVLLVINNMKNVCLHTTELV
jgi:hypothetical protein